MGKPQPNEIGLRLARRLPRFHINRSVLLPAKAALLLRNRFRVKMGTTKAQVHINIEWPKWIKE